MDKRRMKAKQWLKETTDEEYQNFIAKAKLNRRQLEVLELVFKKGLYEYEFLFSSDPDSFFGEDFMRDYSPLFIKD